jgi:membrane-associated phospholipid phosphatase
MARFPSNPSRLQLVLRAGPPAACLLIGVVLVLAGGGGDASVVGGGLIGVAVVLVISNVFFEIGRSEDRAREAERRRRPRS